MTVKMVIDRQIFRLCEARPDLSGALFLTLRLYQYSIDDITSFAMAEKSGNGRRKRRPNFYFVTNYFYFY